MKRNILLLLFLCSMLSTFAQYNKEIKIENVLNTDTTSIGQKIAYLSTNNPEVKIVKITFPPGATTGWHKHAIPVFAYILKGKLTVEFEHHKTLTFQENSSFAESIDSYHNGKNCEQEELILIAIYLGEKGKPLSIKKQ